MVLLLQNENVLSFMSLNNLFNQSFFLLQHQNNFLYYKSRVKYLVTVLNFYYFHFLQNNQMKSNNRSFIT